MRTIYLRNRVDVEDARHLALVSRQRCRPSAAFLPAQNEASCRRDLLLTDVSFQDVHIPVRIVRI